MWAGRPANTPPRFDVTLDRLKNLIFPLLEQNLSANDEYKILEGLNNIAFENGMDGDPDKFAKVIDALDEELSEWK
jgi:hemerythrin-like domain-containing protein